MVPIITDRTTAVAKGLLTDGRYFIHAQSGTPLFLPIWYGHRLDLKNMLITESREEIPLRPELPDLNQLVKEGYILEATIYRSHDISPAAFRNRHNCPPLTGKWIRQFIQEFKEHGFNVTRDAIIHNFSCWMGDLKSGYRDEKNGYHLFTPCGCNPLSLRATSLEKELDWQTTYEW